MKIAFFEVEDWEKEYLKNQLLSSEILFFDEILSLKNVKTVKNFEIISTFIDSRLDKKLLSEFRNLRLIATRSTGFDHIDLSFAAQNNITICNVPHYGENTVAEHTFALILNLSRKIYKSIKQVKEEGSFSLNGLRGFDLKDRTLGVIGLGHIGQHVVRIANGFEMRVIGYDVKEDQKMAEKLNFKYVSLEYLLKNSDIITLHVPYNEKTHHLINLKNINLIKKGAYLINTARGGIVETAALAKALGDKILAGAGLDVLEEEKSIKEEKQLLSKGFSQEINFKVMLQNHLLIDQPNVIITPHNAFNSEEALKRILETTVQNIQSFLEGKIINSVK